MLRILDMGQYISDIQELMQEYQRHSYLINNTVQLIWAQPDEPDTFGKVKTDYYASFLPAKKGWVKLHWQ